MVDMDEALRFKGLGNAAFQKGDNAEAVVNFTKAIELNPKDHVFFSNRSAAYAGMGKFEEALTDADECIRLKNDWAKGYSRRGLALFSLKRYEEAKAAYREGLKLDEHNTALREGLEQVEKVASPFANLFGDNIWTTIATNPQLRPYLNDEGFKAKVRMLQQKPEMMTSMMQDPQIAQLLSVLLGINLSGMPEMSTGSERRENEANNEPRTNDMPDVTPMDTTAEPAKKPESVPEPADEEPKAAKEKKAKSLEEKTLGNMLYKKRDFDGAMEHYNNARELDPENPLFLLNIASVKMEMGQFDECVKSCEEAIELTRSTSKFDFVITAKAYARIGTSYLKQNQYPTAIEYFEKSLVEKYERSVELKLKDAKKKKDEHEKAEYLDADKAIEMKEQGNGKFSSGDYKGAIVDYSESLRRNPNDPKVYSNRAACFTKLMDWGSALKDVEKALELDPKFVKAYIRKGKIQQFLKQYHKAIETYDEGLKLDPQCTELLEGRMQVQRAIAMENATGEVDAQRRQQALEDPEIQALLRDPEVNALLEQMQNNPRAAQTAMANSSVRSKIEKLINAGVLQAR